MKHPHDHIVVGIVTLPYSIILAGWVMPDGSVIHNPIAAEKAAERLNNAHRTFH